MRKSVSGKKRIGGFFLAFLIVALAFLAVGLGTLGSVYSTGGAYAMYAKEEDDREIPSVIFRLNQLTEPDGEGGTKTTYLRVVGCAVNVATIYAEPGTPVTLRLERSTGGTSWSSTPLRATLENFVTPEPETGESSSAVSYDASDVFFRFVSPFTFPTGGWRVSLYPYVGLSIDGTGKAGSPNVLINEVVFVGEKLQSSSDTTGTGEYCVVPAEIYSALPYAEETAEDARARAGALLDAQTYPEDYQTSFYRYGKEEIYSMMTIAEMKRGAEYATGADGLPSDVYTVDSVYGPFGEDFLALGTLIFGMSPFGLRFFPLLAAFGALVVLSRFIVRITKSEKAGLVFAVLFSLSNLAIGYGHLGTPLTLGLFFFACALDLVHRFYMRGLKNADFKSVLPLLAAGLFGAAAICVNGAFLLPVAGVAGLFIAGMVRQQTAKRYHLEKIAEESEGEEEQRAKAGKTVAEYRFRNTAAPTLFFAGLVIGAFLLALLGTLPGYFAYLRAFDNPAAPVMNIFSVAWKTFAGGFAGTNAYLMAGGFDVFYKIFRGDGLSYAVTAVAINPVALLAGAAGVFFGVRKLIVLLLSKERGREWRAGLRGVVLLLAGLLLSLFTASVVKFATPFVVLAYIFAFLLAAQSYTAYRGNHERAVKAVGATALVLLIAAFLLFAVFTFSVPLPASFMTTIFG